MDLNIIYMEGVNFFIYQVYNILTEPSNLRRSGLWYRTYLSFNCHILYSTTHPLSVKRFFVS